MPQLFRRFYCLTVLLYAGPLVAAPDPNTIVEGPLDITVTAWDPVRGSAMAPEPAELFRITKDRAIYRLVGDGRIVTKDARRKDILKIETRDGKMAWTIDKVLNQFDGKVLPAPTLPIKPFECTKLQEERFLYFNFENLNAHLEAALRKNDKESVKTDTERAKTLAEYIEDKNLNKSVGALYKSLSTYANDYEIAVKELEEIRAKSAAAMKKLKEEERAAQARASQKAMLGFMQGMFAAVPQYNTYEYRGVTFYEEKPVNVGEIANGYGQMVGASHELRQEQSRIEYTRGLLKNDMADKYEAAHMKIRDLSRKRSEALRAVGNKEFGLTKQNQADELDEFTTKMSTKFDYQTLIQLQTERAALDRDATRDNPFRIQELCFSKANRPASSPLKQSEQFYDSAKQCVEASRLIPPAKIYDIDRANFLLVSARLANQAADYDIGNSTFRYAYNPRSLYALSIVDRIDQLVPLDLNGLIREQRVTALTGCCLVKEAVEAIAQMGNQRQESSRFQFHIARTYAANGEPKKVAEYLERAIHAGFTNIERCHRCDDLKAMAETNKDVKAIIEIKGTGRLYNPTVIFSRNRPRGVMLEFHNETGFPLTGVKLKLECFINGKLASSKDFGPFERIEPDKSVDVKNIDVQFARFQQWRVTVLAQQGKKEHMTLELIAD